MVTTERASWQEECGGLPCARLNAPQRNHLEQQLKALQYPNVRDLSAWEAFTNDAFNRTRLALPKRVLDFLTSFTRYPTRPAFVIDGLPVGKLPLTPTDGKRPFGKSAVSEGVVVGVASFLGEVFSYCEEKDGDPVHNAAPILGHETRMANSGRSQFLKLTDDYCFGKWAPDWLLLLGLRNQFGTSRPV